MFRLPRAAKKNGEPAEATALNADTEQELERLAADQLPKGTRLWVAHYFSHAGASDEEIRTFLHLLRENGFGTPGEHTEIGADEERSGDGFWHYWAFTIFEASPDVLLAADARARELAEAHRAVYDGWEVQRDRKTGEPRSADVTS